MPDVCLLLLQATAETVYDILSPTPPLNRFAITEGRVPYSRPRRHAQPADLREGVAKAYDTVREVRPQTYPLEIDYGLFYNNNNLTNFSLDSSLCSPGSDRHGSDLVRCSIPRP